MSDPIDLSSLAASLAEIEGIAVEELVPAAEFSTYRVGGPLAVMARVSTPSALVDLAAVVTVSGTQTLVIGRGSNLLVADQGFAGLAIQLTDECAAVSIDGTTVVAGGAADLPRVARSTVKAGLRGFEWAVGVPGSIGGAVRMNAGGHGSDMAASLTSVEIVDLHLGGLLTVPAGSLELGYRSSNIESWQIVVTATLELDSLEHADGERTGDALLSEIVAWRREHQPGGANAGSVFTNPSDDSAGRLIDAAGLKGRRHGTAAVSDKHANFIQADPGGSADDVVALMNQIVEQVADEHGVHLQAETRLIGFPDEIVDALQARTSHDSTGIQHEATGDDETSGNQS